ncbi:transposable element Tcb2 transposase [Trichonephila clavipes]|nr:transposable element Tcb2 transposase [Trichonephila clavipes]
MANNQSVRRHLDAFTRGRIIGKLEEGRSVTRTAIRGFSSGRPRGTTPADDRYIVLQSRRNRRQTAGEIARHTTQATGRTTSRFTAARRLHGGGLFARRHVRCVPLTPAHRRRRSLWCREHRKWRDNEWGRVLFTDESRFSLSSDSHRILIWRERGSRKHPSNIIEMDRYEGRGVLVWGGIMLGSRTDLHIFDAGSVNRTRYCNEILLPYVRLFRGAMGLQFLFMDDNAPCHRTVAAEMLLESRRLAARILPPVTIRELRLALQDECTAMPQQLIDTLILSMGRRCETCLECNIRVVKTQRKKLDDILRGRVIGRLECGRTQLEVSEELGIEQSVISRLWQRFQDDGNVSRCYSTGRPRVTMPNEDRYLAVTAKKHKVAPELQCRMRSGIWQLLPKKHMEHSIRSVSSALFSYRYDSFKADRVLTLRAHSSICS